MGLFVDPENRKLYWTVYDTPTNSGMYVADMGDPSNPAKIQNIKRLINGGSGLTAVTIDPVNGKIYYSGYPVSMRVGSINASNPATPTSVTSISSQYTRAIALDRLRGKIYWTDWNTGNVWVGDITPQSPTTITNSKQLTTGGSITFMTIDFEKGDMYTRGDSGTIYISLLNLTAPSAPTNMTALVAPNNIISPGSNDGGISIIDRK